MQPGKGLLRERAAKHRFDRDFGILLQSCRVAYHGSNAMP